MDFTAGLFYAYAANLVVQFADSYLTQIAISHGAKEGNPVMAWMLNKLGVAGASAVKVGAAPILLAFLGAAVHDPVIPNALMAAVTLPIVIRSIVLLKKDKISILNG